MIPSVTCLWQIPQQKFNNVIKIGSIWSKLVRFIIIIKPTGIKGGHLPWGNIAAELYITWIQSRKYKNSQRTIAEKSQRVIRHRWSGYWWISYHAIIKRSTRLVLSLASLWKSRFSIKKNQRRSLLNALEKRQIFISSKSWVLKNILRRHSNP